MSDTLQITATLRIPLSEIELSYVRSSGPGGQNVNKVNSKCVLRWAALSSPALLPPVCERLREVHANKLTLAGELVLSSDRFRDQKRNYEDCLDKLRQLLLEVARPPKQRKASKPTRSSKRRRLDHKRAHSSKKASRRGDWE